MSMPMGMVFIFDRQISWMDICTVFSEITQLSGVTTQGNLKIANADWLSGGLLAHYSSPMGFGILQLTWSPNILAGDDDVVGSYFDQIQAVVISAIENLGLIFGYLTHYADCFDEQWIENNILMNLLAEGQAMLELDLIHWVAHNLSVSIGELELQTVLYESEKGRLLCLGKNRNPFL